VSGCVSTLAKANNNLPLRQGSIEYGSKIEEGEGEGEEGEGEGEEEEEEEE
jgi:hypothetical protein